MMSTDITGNKKVLFNSSLQYVKIVIVLGVNITLLDVNYSDIKIATLLTRLHR